MLDSETESDDEILLFPITEIDTTSQSETSEREETESESESPEKPKALMTLRQRRLSKSYNSNPLKPLNVNRLHWIHAIEKARALRDPWEEFHINDLESEICSRHRYNALKKAWTVDEVQVKMSKKSFTRGAMRQCFRLKKLSGFSGSGDWTHAQNYVAKSYIEDVDRNVYFEDVKLQMDAKLWGEEYNRHNPPKKVDIFQMYILEFKNRKGSPLFHLEHFIEGDYVKYNSNSGFVEETLRLTPQAFSHFTFERSGHQLIVVDIQGVGDLYTDPQIHTVDGGEYGDGNLGEKGMALFFHSHTCNNICHSLGLSEFDLSEKEMNMHKDFLAKQRRFAKTCVRGTEEHVYSASPKEQVDLTHLFLRQRSSCSVSSVGSPSDCPSSPGGDDEPMSIDSPVGRVRMKYISESDSASMTEDEEREAFSRAQAARSRSSCVLHELDLRKLASLKIGDSILGQIHHEMAKYHEIGRFAINDSDIDWESALFHEEHAAQLGVLEAILTMARLYLDLPRDVLANCIIKKSDETVNEGLNYMIQAAEAGDRSAMIYIAKAFHSGDNLGTLREMSWEDAIYWYDRAVETNDTDEGGEFDSTMHDPTYGLLASQADIYRQGGHGLTKDPQKAGDLYNAAAEAAMEAMKGRLANKYFMLAEEAYGEVEED